MIGLDREAVAAAVTTGSDEVQPRFGRSEVLRVGSMAVFGFAMRRLLSADPASAHHLSPPSPCCCSSRCHCCSGSTCCTSGCTSRSGCGANGGWYACSGGTKYWCKDWWEQGNPCICRSTVGAC